MDEWTQQALGLCIALAMLVLDEYPGDDLQEILDTWGLGSWTQREEAAQAVARILGPPPGA